MFYVWVGIFSLTMIAQFWSYANEIYTRADGDRLFPLIAVGSAAGAPLGAAVAEHLFGLGMSPFTMMQIAAGLLLVHLVLYRVVNRRVSATGARPAQAPIKAGNGFALVLKSRYLALVALLLVLLNIVNTVGEYILGQAVVRAADAQVAVRGRLRQGGLHRDVLRRLLLLDERGHHPHPGLRRLAHRQAVRDARRPPRPARSSRSGPTGSRRRGPVSWPCAP